MDVDISGQTHGPPIVPEPFTTEYPPLEEGGAEREILLPGTAQSDGKGILSLSYRVGFRQSFHCSRIDILCVLCVISALCHQYLSQKWSKTILHFLQFCVIGLFDLQNDLKIQI